MKRKPLIALIIVLIAAIALFGASCSSDKASGQSSSGSSAAELFSAGGSASASAELSSEQSSDSSSDSKGSAPSSSAVGETHVLAYFANEPEGTEVVGEMDIVDYAHGETVTVADCAYSIEGYRFAGWALQGQTADLTQGKYRVGQSFEITEDVILYAQWGKAFTDEKKISDAVIYIAPGVSGIGSAVLCREGMEDKLGFADVDEDNYIVGFTFYFEESEGGDVVGILVGEDTYVIRDKAEGIYVLYDYAAKEYVEQYIYLDGYGAALVAYSVGDLLKSSYYGTYTYNSTYHDYEFIQFDAATGEPVVVDGRQVGFYFTIVKTDGILGAADGEDSGVRGYFIIQGVESGSFLKYDNGEYLNYRLDLNGYGQAKIYYLDEAADTVELIAEGEYAGTENYGEFDEWLFTPSDEYSEYGEFRFIVNLALAGEGYITVYVEFNENYYGDFAEKSGGTVSLDGYGGMVYQSAGGGGRFEGLVTFGDTLATFYVYDPETLEYLSTMYFNFDSAAREFTLSTDGFIVDGGVLTGYVGEGGVIVIPESVTEIADDVFNYLLNSEMTSPITHVVVHGGVTRIGARAFENENTLQRVTFLGENAAQIVIDFAKENDPFRWPSGAFVIVVPEAAKAEISAAWTAEGCTYKILGSEEVDVRPEFEVDDGGTLIAYNGSHSDGEKVDLTLTTGKTALGDEILITAIAPEVFKGASYLRSVDLGNAAIIGVGAFENCASLENVIFNEVKEIGASAFAGCPLLAGDGGVLRLGGVETIGESAFYGCESIDEVVVSSALKTVGAGAFMEIAVYEDDIFFLTIENGDPSALPELQVRVNGIETVTPFAGAVAYRIKVPNIEYALACYEDARWWQFESRLYIESGEEKGVYFDGSNTLVLDGRAEFLASDVWLYLIEGAKITFYQFDGSAENYYTTLTGTYLNNSITVNYGGAQYNFKLPKSTETYVSADGLYTIQVDPLELSPDTWSAGADANTNYVDAVLNGRAVIITVSGYNKKVISNVYEDGEIYELELTFGANNSFTYGKKAQTKITYTAADGGPGTFTVYFGYVSGALYDENGSELWTETSTMLVYATLSGNTYAFTKNGYKFEVTVSKETLTFTFVYTAA